MLKNAINLEDDSDILEELSKGGTTLLPRISGMSDIGTGGNRRRGDEDDEDELLERLSKSKRQTPNLLSPQPDSDPPGLKAECRSTYR